MSKIKLLIISLLLCFSSSLFADQTETLIWMFQDYSLEDKIYSYNFYRDIDDPTCERCVAVKDNYLFLGNPYDFFERFCEDVRAGRKPRLGLWYIECKSREDAKRLARQVISYFFYYLDFDYKHYQRTLTRKEFYKNVANPNRYNRGHNYCVDCEFCGKTQYNAVESFWWSLREYSAIHYGRTKGDLAWTFNNWIEVSDLDTGMIPPSYDDFTKFLNDLSNGVVDDETTERYPILRSCGKAHTLDYQPYLYAGLSTTGLTLTYKNIMDYFTKR